MAMSFEELMAIEISSASKFEEAVPKIPTSVYLVTQTDIQCYGYKTL